MKIMRIKCLSLSFVFLSLLSLIEFSECQSFNQHTPDKWASHGANYTKQAYHTASSMWDQFNQFRKQFNVQFSKDEEQYRLGIFKEAFNLISKLNSQNLPFLASINEFATMTMKEIISQRTGLLSDNEKFTDVNTMGDEGTTTESSEDESNEERRRRKRSTSDIPKNWDWRDYGIVNPPRNQGKCGSCWAFSAASGIESDNMKKLIQDDQFDKNNSIKISEQDMIDCAKGSLGCKGGMPQVGWKWIINNNVDRLEHYPYEGKKKECRHDDKYNENVTISSYKRLPTGKDDQLVESIYKYGPVSVAIQVTRALAFYKSGIFENSHCNPKKINHAVIAVGYGEDEKGKKYYIIKNSWGERWGEDGYFKLTRDKPNHCGVSQQSYYPIVPGLKETLEIQDKLNKYKNKS